MPTIKQSIRFLPLLALASALSGASLACTANIPVIGRTITPTPTITPTVTDTPTVTRTFTPSKTPTPEPTALNIDWPVIFSDSFDDNRSNWLVGTFNDEWTKGSIAVRDGKYRFSLTAKQPVFFVSAPNLPSQTDFYLSVDVRKTSSFSEANYGLYFRFVKDSGFYFNIDADEQKYEVFEVHEAGWITRKEPSTAPEINYDAVNRIAVLAEGSQVAFYINGEEVFFLPKVFITEGYVGLGWCLFTVGDLVEVEFDNYEVRAPR